MHPSQIENLGGNTYFLPLQTKIVMTDAIWVLGYNMATISYWLDSEKNKKKGEFVLETTVLFVISILIS